MECIHPSYLELSLSSYSCVCARNIAIFFSFYSLQLLLFCFVFTLHSSIQYTWTFSIFFFHSFPPLFLPLPASFMAATTTTRTIKDKHLWTDFLLFHFILYNFFSHSISFKWITFFLKLYLVIQELQVFFSLFSQCFFIFILCLNLPYTYTHTPILNWLWILTLSSSWHWMTLLKNHV